MSKHGADKQQNQSGSHNRSIVAKEAAKKIKPTTKYIVHKTGLIYRQESNPSCNIPETEVPEPSTATVFDDGYFSHILMQRKYHID